MNQITVGSRIRFDPQGGNWWWTVRARNDRFIIATQQAPFLPKGKVQYTVVDLTGWTYTYNGVRPGMVRSSLNTLGGGYDLGPDGEGCEQMLAELDAGTWELSRRRVMGVRQIQVES
jgi:hypothetical protein